MRNLWTLATATLLQLRRERLFAAAAVAALLFFVAGLALAPLSQGHGGRILLDVGLGGTSLVATLMAIGATVALVGRELHEQRAHVLLARCMHRHTYVGGRALGLGLGMAGLIACMGGMTALACLMAGTPLPAALWPALLLTMVEAQVVVCATLLFATWASPWLAGACAGGMVVAGHMSAELLALAPESPWPGWYRGAYWLLPDMQRLSLRMEVAHGSPAAWAAVAGQVGYGLSYAALALSLAMLVLDRRRCL